MTRLISPVLLRLVCCWLHDLWRIGRATQILNSSIDGLGVNRGQKKQVRLTPIGLPIRARKNSGIQY